jgi:Ca2+-binding RTX toxin-like protein
MYLGPGSDTASGGDGNDYIVAVDNRVGNDTIDCGPGDDRVVIDINDTVHGQETDPFPNCEAPIAVLVRPNGP